MPVENPNLRQEGSIEVERGRLRHSYQAKCKRWVPVGDGSQRMEGEFVYGEEARAVRGLARWVEPPAQGSGAVQ